MVKHHCSHFSIAAEYANPALINVKTSCLSKPLCIGDIRSGHHRSGKHPWCAPRIRPNRRTAQASADRFTIGCIQQRMRYNRMRWFRFLRSPRLRLGSTMSVLIQSSGRNSAEKACSGICIAITVRMSAILVIPHAVSYIRNWTWSHILRPRSRLRDSTQQ
jgi:hypothetical protein